MRTIRTAKLSPVMFGKQRKQKRNTNISVENNSYCSTIHKHNTTIFFTSTREVSHTHASESE